MLGNRWNFFSFKTPLRAFRNNAGFGTRKKGWQAKKALL
jgi:hypothetical protein